MKQFFSIIIDHEYDRINDNTKGVSNDLAIIPANSNAKLVSNNQLWFRSKNGGIDCYIEDDETLKNESDMLFFWVVCINEAFYSYTDYPNHINFSNPYYSWSNSDESFALQQMEHCDLHPGMPPKQAIGCIGILINIIDASENREFTINFNVRETYWEYHISPKNDLKQWNYMIVDEIGEWNFKQINNNDDITFQSKKPIAYKNKATNRLKLVWKPTESNFQEEQTMILPFANYAYKMVKEDNKEITPIYIHI